jgi:hypothetical protein
MTMNLCTAKVASGAPCRAWAIHDSDPPLCPAHSGLLGAPLGNTNAITHGYYHRKQSSGETDPLFTGADNVALKQEAALIRVALYRLSQYLLDTELPVEKITAIAPLIFSGTRALAYIQRQVIETDDRENLDQTLDQLSEWLGVDL